MVSLSKLEMNKRKSYLKLQYGVTIEWYERTFIGQEGKCAICKKPQEEIRYALCVDHNHDTGRARGLLCTNCNSAIGYFKDNIENIKSSIVYLEEYS
jgi:hypothetical protein